MASARAARQLAAMACRPPSVRACIGVTARAARRAGGAHLPDTGANAQQAIRRLLTGESASSAGTLGARATALGPSGTKRALVLAKALLHDDHVERALIGEGEELEDT